VGVISFVLAYYMVWTKSRRQLLGLPADTAPERAAIWSEAIYSAGRGESFRQ